MGSWKEQALIAAPVEDVWKLLEDPVRYAEWNGDVVDVTGVPTTIEKGSSFDMTNRGPLGLKATTTFKVEELDDMHEIKLRCQTSGWYSHWFLTEARGETFTVVEMGVEPIPSLQGQVTRAMHTKGYLRRAAHDTLDGLKRALSAAKRSAA